MKSLTIFLCVGLFRASVPSGASTGLHEACELRDNNPQEFNGLGVKHAVRNINEIIGPALLKKDLLVTQQAEIDSFMVNELDGTPNKSEPQFLCISADGG